MFYEKRSEILFLKASFNHRDLIVILKIIHMLSYSSATLCRSAAMLYELGGRDPYEVYPVRADLTPLVEPHGGLAAFNLVLGRDFHEDIYAPARGPFDRALLYENTPRISKPEWMEIGDALMQIEKRPIMVVDPSQVLSLRLDGRNFTKQMKIMRDSGLLTRKGYCHTFTELMRGTLASLMSTLGALCGYTYSDEMTLLLPGKVSQHPQGGHRDKLNSLAASHASSFFTRALYQLLQKRQKGTIGLPAGLSVAFDCRIGAWQDLRTAFGLVLWRAYNCAVLGLSYGAQDAGCSQEIYDSGSKAKLDWLLGHNALPLPSHAIYGTFYVWTREGDITEVRGSVLRNVKRGMIEVTEDEILYLKGKRYV